MYQPFGPLLIDLTYLLLEIASSPLDTPLASLYTLMTCWGERKEGEGQPLTCGQK